MTSRSPEKYMIGEEPVKIKSNAKNLLEKLNTSWRYVEMIPFYKCSEISKKNRENLSTLNFLMRLLAAEMIQHKQSQSSLIGHPVILPTGTFWNPSLRPTKYVYFFFCLVKQGKNILYFIQTPVVDLCRLQIRLHFPHKDVILTDPINLLLNFHGPLVSVGFQFTRYYQELSLSQYVTVH